MGTDMDKYLEKAEVLIEALPYIQRFNRRIIVVKYGGSAMVDETLKKQVIQDVTLLKLVGFKPIIVHGGGKEISRWVGKVGMEPHFINGLRVTDEDTMEIAEMVLNKVNKSLVQMVQELGVKAVGIIKIHAITMVKYHREPIICMDDRTFRIFSKFIRYHRNTVLPLHSELPYRYRDS